LNNMAGMMAPNSTAARMQWISSSKELEKV
jgi:hypothetical protein